MAKRGRPSTPFDQGIADRICERLSGGESFLAMEKEDWMPARTVVFRWLSENTEFAADYARARMFWAESEFERMFEIADTPQIGVKTKVSDKGVETITGDMTEHRKLQIDTRKWALARMNKKFADRIEQRIADPDGNKIEVIISGMDKPEDK